MLDSVAAVEPWQSFTIDDLRVVPLGDDAAALVYATRAQRAGQAPYVAAITSVYRRTDSGWELVIHQQAVPALGRLSPRL